MGHRPPPDALQLIASPRRPSRLHQEKPHPRPLPVRTGRGDPRRRRFRDSFPVLNDFKGLRGGKFPFLNCSFVILTARQPESRTVSRAPVRQILWVRGFRGHTISGRGFNLFKPLRRHFRATPFLPSGPLVPRSRQGKRLDLARSRRGSGAARRGWRRPSPREFGPARSGDSGRVRSSTRSIARRLPCIIIVGATIIASLSRAICN